MKVTVLSNQTLTDVAIQVYGSVEGVFELARENGLQVTDRIEPGRVLEYQASKVINKQIVQYYAVQGISPATAFDKDLDSRIFDETFDLTFD